MLSLANECDPLTFVWQLLSLFVLVHFTVAGFKTHPPHRHPTENPTQRGLQPNQPSSIMSMQSVPAKTAQVTTTHEIPNSAEQLLSDGLQ